MAQNATYMFSEKRTVSENYFYFSKIVLLFLFINCYLVFLLGFEILKI